MPTRWQRSSQFWKMSPAGRTTALQSGIGSEFAETVAGAILVVTTEFGGTLATRRGQRGARRPLKWRESSVCQSGRSIFALITLSSSGMLSGGNLFR